MRNLKKILALVLALVMSLSLMATAGATDFKDDGDISDTYRQAAQVLFELGVFNGDQNGQFNPNQPIARSEVAAILYRIATGDIGLEGNKTYAPYNQFPDVTAEDWYAGYVTYCANAGYIKGRNTGKFDAKDNVTGYEVLAMILRAVGYDKNNEFVGSDWQLHTASIAREKGVLVNVLEDPNVQLSNPATREVVAELLFRASLLPQVSWNAASLSYVENGETLAYENLGMEQIEGVVVANEWADLRYDYIDVDEDETVLETADGERTLAVPTDLTDIGESRYAYVVGTKVLGQLEDTGKNVIKDCVDQEIPGEAIYVSTLADELKLTDDTQYFINFSDYSYDKSDYRIEYSISFRNQDALEWFQARYLGWTAANGYSLEYLRGLDNADRDPKDIEYLNKSGTYYSGTKGDGTDGGLTYSRVIPAGDTITWLDKAIMQGIFGSAASFDSTHQNFGELSDDIVHAGYVYAGSKSNPNTADTKDDLSDDRTYQQFEDEYIGITAHAYVYDTTNGEWLKIIDNDNDGKVDFVLDTYYSLVEVDSYNDRTGVYTFSSINYADSDDAVCRDADYEFQVGDMLLGAWIDDQFVVEQAESEILVIDKYSWKDISVTTRDGDVKYESGAYIYNLTGYADRIEDMVYGVEYEVFYDHYGFIRAFRPVDGDRHYGLLTDLWLTNQSNTHYIDNQIATVELSFLDENGKLDLHEYDVAGHSKADPNVFVGINQKDVNGGVNDTDNLQRAIAHLGMSYGSNGALWSRVTKNSATGVYEHSSTVLGDEFDYDGDTRSNGQHWSDTAADGTVETDNYATVTSDTKIDFSWTNVARYSFNEDGTVNLSTVSEYAYDKAGNQLYYWNNRSAFTGAGTVTVMNSDEIRNAVVGGTRATLADWRTAYIQSNDLDESDPTVAAAINTALELAVLGNGGHLVPVYAVDYVMLEKTAISSKSSYHLAIDPSYNDGSNLMNTYVNTVADTVFYIVTPDEIYPIVDYAKLPDIALENIHAIYAVAKNVEQDSYGSDYWVADVVVIETSEELGNVYSYMIYNIYDNYRAGQKSIIHELDAIDCRTGELVSVVVDSAWAQPYDTGFYLLSDASVASDGSITAGGMVTVESRITDAEGNWTDEYADYGIYAGKVIRSNEIETRASYIDVFDEYTDNSTNDDTERVLIGAAPWYSVYATSYAEAAKSAGRLYAQALSSHDYAETSPNNHEVIYVKYQNVVRFIIDTDFTGGYYWYTPVYLNDGTTNRVWPNGEHPNGVEIDSVYERAMVEQTGVGGSSSTVDAYTVTITVTSTGTDANNAEAIASITGENVSGFKNNKDGTYTVQLKKGVVDGYTLTIKLAGGYKTASAGTVIGLAEGYSDIAKLNSSGLTTSAKSGTVVLNPVYGNVKLNLNLAYDSTTAENDRIQALQEAAYAKVFALEEELKNTTFRIDTVGGSSLGVQVDGGWLGITGLDSNSAVKTIAERLDAKVNAIGMANTEEAIADACSAAQEEAVVATVAAAVYSMNRLVGSGLKVDWNATTGEWEATRNNDGQTTKYWNGTIEGAIEKAWPAFAQALGDAGNESKQADAIHNVIVAFQDAFDTIYPEITKQVTEAIQPSLDSRYMNAYGGAGISVKTDEATGTITVTVNTTALARAIAGYDDKNDTTYGGMKSTIDPDSTAQTFDGYTVAKCLFVGVQFDAPAWATGVTCSINNVDKGLTEKGDGSDLSVNADETTTFKNYIAIAVDSGGGYQPRSGSTKAVYEMTFIGGGSYVTVTRTVIVNFE